MPDTETGSPTPPSTAGKGIGSKLTRKLGPLPVWGWALVGGAVLVVVYRWYSAKNASATAAAAAANPSTGTAGVGTASGGLGTPGSNGYQDNGQLNQLSQQLSDIQKVLGQGTGSGAGVGAAGDTGSGSSTAGTNSFQQLIAGSGTVSTQQQINAALAAGQKLWTQIAPGVFVPYVPGSTLGITPVYIQDPGGAPIGAGWGGGVGPPVTGSGGVSGAGGSASPVGGTAGPPASIAPSGSGSAVVHTPLPAVKSA
jgi:hypothetical protein